MFYHALRQVIFATLLAVIGLGSTGTGRSFSAAGAAKEDTYATAYKAYIAKDYKAAEGYLKDALQKDPKSLAARQLLAQTYALLGGNENLQKAQDLFLALRPENTVSADIWLRVIAAWHNQPEWDQALAAFNAGELEKSDALFESILARWEKDPIIETLRPVAYAYSSDPEKTAKAIALFRTRAAAGDADAAGLLSIAFKNSLTQLKARGLSGAKAVKEINQSLSAGGAPVEMKAFAEALFSGAGLPRDAVYGLRLMARARLADPELAKTMKLDLATLPVSCEQFAKAISVERLALGIAADEAPPAPACEGPLTDSAAAALFNQLEELIRLQVKDKNYHKIFTEEHASYHFDIVPPGFMKPVSIVSDADSQTFAQTSAHRQLLNYELGLPIPASIFVVDSADTSPEPRAQDEYSSSLFFSSTGGTDALSGNAAMPSMIRQWHRGYFDHLHGFFNSRVTAAYRFSAPRNLAALENLDLMPLFASADGTPIDGVSGSNIKFDVRQWLNARHSVLRLFLTKKPSRAASFAVTAPNARFAFDVNAKRAYTKLVREDGSDLWMVELPVGQGATAPFLSAFPISAAEAGSFALSVKASDCPQPDAAAGCDAELVKIETDTVGRPYLQIFADWMSEFGMHPVLFTAHGGDRLGSFGSSKLADAEMNRPDRPLDRLEVSFDLPIAGYEKGKSFLSDIIEPLGIRGIRPFSSDYPGKGVMNVFPAAALVAREFGNTVSFPTHWIPSPNLTAKPVVFNEKLDMTEQTKNLLLQYKNCSFQSASWLPGYIDTSLRSAKSDDPAGEIWYTHLADHCARSDGQAKPTGFDEGTANSLKILSRSYFGRLTPDEQKTYPNRLWVETPSAAFRSRILVEEVNEGADLITLDGAQIKIKSRPSRFYDNEPFPRPGLASMDLNGLTFVVPADMLAASVVTVDGKPLNSVVKKLTGGKGYVTIIDTTEAIALMDKINWNIEPAGGAGAYEEIGGQKRLRMKSASTGPQKVCFLPGISSQLLNISAIGFTVAGDALPQFALEISSKTGTGNLALSTSLLAFESQYGPGPAAIVQFKSGWSTQMTGPDGMAARRFLVPVYDVARLRNARADGVPAILSGEPTRICIHALDDKGFDFSISQIRAYRSNTNNSGPGDPLLIGGMVDKAILEKGGGYFVRATPVSGKPVYAAVNDSGFYYAHLPAGAASPVDNALNDVLADIALMRFENGQYSKVQQVSLQLLKSELDVDFDAGVTQ